VGIDPREELVRVVIELPEPDMGVSGERVWAAPLGADLYEIRNSPWHSRQVNWGDVVKARARSDDQWPIFVEVVRRSGHRTMHVYILEEGQERRHEFLTKLNELGATYENANDKMYALDFEPDVNVQPVLAYLEPLKSKGLLDYRINDN
jgi:hypothetical protein